MNRRVTHAVRKFLVFISLVLNHFNIVLAQDVKPVHCRLLDVTEFYIRLNSNAHPLVIDTRTWHEFRKERIPGALLAESRAQLKEISDTVDRDRAVFIYCEEDYRSSTACEMLIEQGFRNVFDLEGGLIEWRLSGYELDREKIRRRRKRP
jgi:rhodanese-related sulfurtransferase